MGSYVKASTAKDGNRKPEFSFWLVTSAAALLYSNRDHHLKHDHDVVRHESSLFENRGVALCWSLKRFKALSRCYMHLLQYTLCGQRPKKHQSVYIYAV